MRKMRITERALRKVVKRYLIKEATLEEWEATLTDEKKAQLSAAAEAMASATDEELMSAKMGVARRMGWRPDEESEEQADEESEGLTAISFTSRDGTTLDADELHRRFQRWIGEEDVADDGSDAEAEARRKISAILNKFHGEESGYEQPAWLTRGAALASEAGWWTPAQAGTQAAAAEDEEDEEEVEEVEEWEVGDLYDLYTADDQDWPLRMGEFGSEDGVIGKLQDVVTTVVDGYYGPNTAEAIAKALGKPDGSKHKVVTEEEYRQLMGEVEEEEEPAGDDTPTEETPESVGPEGAATATINDVEWTRVTEGSETRWTSARGDIDVPKDDKTYARSVGRLRWRKEPDSDATLWVVPNDGEESNIVGNPRGRDDLTTKEKTEKTEINDKLVPSFKDLQQKAVALQESVSRSRLRSMILREILRRAV